MKFSRIFPEISKYVTIVISGFQFQKNGSIDFLEQIMLSFLVGKSWSIKTLNSTLQAYKIETESSDSDEIDIFLFLLKESVSFLSKNFFSKIRKNSYVI